MFASRLITFFRLGLVNVLRVVIYRLQLRLGYFERMLNMEPAPIGPLFSQSGWAARDHFGNWARSVRYFGWFEVPLEDVPDWFANPFSPGATFEKADAHWSKIPDFNSGIGDIKIIWELSRMNWVVDAAVSYRKTGSKSDLVELDRWLNDWIQKNPPNIGPNWKCGQEVSIRLIHLIASWMVVHRDARPSDVMLSWVEHHCRRIRATMSYAIGQQNNHAISEAATLFVAGTWINHHDGAHPTALKWQQHGRKWLERLSRKLILDDGTFSQYSVNYHRLMLDAFTFAEYCRIRFEQVEFSKSFYRNLDKAVAWLSVFVDPETGDAPCFGANDGAQLFQLRDMNYRDYRWSLAFSESVLGLKGSTWPLDFFRKTLLDDLSLLPSQSRTVPSMQVFRHGGFSVLRSGGTLRAYSRLPGFAFRPSQADIHHVDIWNGSCRVFVDAGTYSYNAGDGQEAFFGSTEAHNTARFNDRDQMRRIGRFLFSDWLSAKQLSFEEASGRRLLSSTYKDYRNCVHQRTIETTVDCISVIDCVDGEFEECVIRWRTPYSISVLGDNVFSVNGVNCRIDSDQAFSLAIEKSHESLHYLKADPVNVVALTLRRPGRVGFHFHLVSQK